jgi:hypothetical protein
LVTRESSSNKWDRIPCLSLLQKSHVIIFGVAKKSWDRHERLSRREAVPLSADAMKPDAMKMSETPAPGAMQAPSGTQARDGVPATMTTAGRIRRAPLRM